MAMSTGIFTAMAEDDAGTVYTPSEEGRQAMVNELVGSKATPEAEAPFSDGDALPISPGMPTLIYDNKLESYGMSSTSNIQIDPTVARTATHSYGGYRVVCHGNAVNSLGYDYVMVIDNTTMLKCKLYCYNTADNTFVSQSDDIVITSIPRLDIDKSYLACVRKDYDGKSMPDDVDLDPFSGTASSQLRRNEMVNTFVSLTAVDLDHDGIEEPIFCDGERILVFSFTDTKALVLKQVVNVSDETYSYASCTSLAYDINGDGTNDYVAIVIPDANNNASNAKMLFTFLTPSADGSINVTRRQVASSEQSQFFNPKSYRAMVSATKYYPTGMLGDTWLAVATTSMQDGVTLNRGLDAILGMPMLSFVKPDWTKIQNGDAVWYDMKLSTTAERKYYYLYYAKESNLIYDDYYLESASYGKPTLCQAFMSGIGTTASIMWEGDVYEWDPASANIVLKSTRSSTVQELLDRRYIGCGVAATSLGTTSDFNFDGKEVITVLYTLTDKVSYNTPFDHCYLYQYDRDLKFACVGKDDTGYHWQLTMLDTDISKYTQGVSMLAQPVIDGLRLKLLKQSVNVSTPNIECVLAVPPYVDGKSTGMGNVSFSNSQSTSQSMTESTSQSVGVSIGFKFEFLSWLKMGIQEKFSQSWSNSLSTNLSFSHSSSHSVDKGEDMVAFTYVPVDVFDYEIVSDNPTYNGQTFSLMRARTAGIRHDVMTLRNYNDLVGSAGGFVVDKSVLPHTAGDVSTYAHCPEDDLSPVGARSVLYDRFGVKENEIIGMSNIYDVPSQGTSNSISLSYGEGGTVSEGGSESNSVSLSFDLGGHIPVSFSASVENSESYSWGMSTGWNKSVSIQGSVPSIVDKADNFYSYRLVWYRVHCTDADTSDRQDFMVGNWIICDDQTGNTSGVGDIATDVKPFDSRVFTIDGRYLGVDIDRLSPGIYIRNGHKIVITR